MSEFGNDVSNSEVSEVESGTDVNETEMDDELSNELDACYNSHIESEDSFDEEKDVDESTVEEDDAEASIEHMKCRNEGLDGKEHPETDVPFEKRQVEVDGKQYEVVVPVFESAYDAQLPESMYKATDREQFKECNSQLKNEVATNKELRETFDEEQLEQIENGDTPDGYTWHHDAEAGKMQLVDTEIHQRTGHTGGRSIWGGGTDNR